MKDNNNPFSGFNRKAERLSLKCSLSMPEAGSFLWNKVMMLQLNNRGYAIGQFMQPEPSKYSYAPNLEAKTFMQPEHNYYANHPGRFFYIKDNDSNRCFSLPFAPMNKKLDKFSFSPGLDNIQWQVEHDNLRIEITVSLATEQAIEMWSCTLTSLDTKPRNISVYPCFSIGYMSWMNQSADFDVELNAIVASSITPYQQVVDYPKQQHFADKTYLLAEQQPTSWCCNQSAFEGLGGMVSPDALNTDLLGQENALYEVPTAVMQYQCELAPEQQISYRFLFGPAKDKQQIASIKQQFFQNKNGFVNEQQNYQDYIAQGAGSIKIESNDQVFDQFVNHWLPRQMYYHGDVNRLTTDPQTRNYLQDNLGMSYINASTARAAFLTALSQQARSGEMPDGVLIHQDATLKYINQIPHTDHCVWLPICLQAYLNESNDPSLLAELVAFSDSDEQLTVKQHIELALDWLIDARDSRGLSYINQGDWCDPMNMVGHKGFGVSTWLTLASAYAIKVWQQICANYQLPLADKYSAAIIDLNHAVNLHCWDGGWYSRGITDDNVSFGVASDTEGRIFLNPQSWSMLSGAANAEKQKLLIAAVEQQLDTPFGVMMLAPSYTKMREDVGRISQKFPGSAENGSVYNHAAIFYAFSLFQIGEGEKAFQVMRKMLPDDDYRQRGQLANFIPNYYRGAYHQHPSRAGRSSQLFNTGTVSWFYRCVVEGIAGLQGDNGELVIRPQLPKQWQSLTAVRQFSGATFTVHIKKSTNTTEQVISLDGVELTGDRIKDIVTGTHYVVQVSVPAVAPPPKLTIVMGVSGCGKSSIAKKLTDVLEGQFFEGDDFHSDSAKLSMSQGVALTDAQREPWIAAMCAKLSTEQELGNDCFLAYSGLRAEHRQRFRQLGFQCQFIYLKAKPEVIAKRLQSRTEHFFDAGLLASQFAALQDPINESDVSVITANGNFENVLRQSIKAVSRAVNKDE